METYVVQNYAAGCAVWLVVIGGLSLLWGV
jgi:nitrogen fixation-related uncharacterized protein